MRELFEESIGTGPAPRPIDEQVQIGRKTLRRRRRATAAAGIAGVMVIAGAGWTLGNPNSPDQGSTGAPAGQDSTGASKKQTSDKPPKQEDDSTLRVSNTFPVVFETDGSLLIKDGWRITQRITNPEEFEAPRRSLGAPSAWLSPTARPSAGWCSISTTSTTPRGTGSTS